MTYRLHADEPLCALLDASPASDGYVFGGTNDDASAGPEGLDALAMGSRFDPSPSFEPYLGYCDQIQQELQTPYPHLARLLASWADIEYIHERSPTYCWNDFRLDNREVEDDDPILLAALATFRFLRERFQYHPREMVIDVCRRVGRCTSGPFLPLRAQADIGAPADIVDALLEGHLSVQDVDALYQGFFLNPQDLDDRAFLLQSSQHIAGHHLLLSLQAAMIPVRFDGGPGEPMLGHPSVDNCYSRHCEERYIQRKTLLPCMYGGSYVSTVFDAFPRNQWHVYYHPRRDVPLPAATYDHLCALQDDLETAPADPALFDLYTADLGILGVVLEQAYPSLEDLKDYVDRLHGSLELPSAHVQLLPTEAFLCHPLLVAWVFVFDCYYHFRVFHPVAYDQLRERLWSIVETCVRLDEVEEIARQGSTDPEVQLAESFLTSSRRTFLDDYALPLEARDPERPWRVATYERWEIDCVESRQSHYLACLELQRRLRWLLANDHQFLREWGLAYTEQFEEGSHPIPLSAYPLVDEAISSACVAPCQLLQDAFRSRDG